MYGFMRATVAHHMDSVTGVAFLKMMLVREEVPVRALIRHYDPCAFAQRTHAVEAATTAARMNSDLLGIPFIASRSDSGTLKVMMSTFSFFICSFLKMWTVFDLQCIITKYYS